MTCYLGSKATIVTMVQCPSGAFAVRLMMGAKRHDGLCVCLVAKKLLQRQGDTSLSLFFRVGKNRSVVVAAATAPAFIHFYSSR